VPLPKKRGEHIAGPGATGNVLDYSRRDAGDTSWYLMTPLTLFLFLARISSLCAAVCSANSNYRYTSMAGVFMAKLGLAGDRSWRRGRQGASKALNISSKTWQNGRQVTGRCVTI